MYRSLSIQREHFILAAAVIVVLIAAAIFVQWHRGELYSELQSLKVVPEHEHFTELYFEDYSGLPKVIRAGQPIAFIFVIHNLEGKEMTYPYVVSLQTSSEAWQMAEGTVTVGDNGFASIPVQYEASSVPQEAEVVIDLTSLQQELHFSVAGVR